MDHFFRQTEPEIEPKLNWRTTQQILTRLFGWLSSLINPTKEDQENAGIYLGGEGRA